MKFLLFFLSILFSTQLLADTIIIINDRNSIKGEVIGLEKVVVPGEQNIERSSVRSLLMTQELYNLNLSAKKYIQIITERIVIQSSPVVVTTCSKEPGEGKGDWKNFYNVGGIDAKAKALEDAILGVGPKSSYPLVKYFDGIKKPRSWEEFSARINAADIEIGHGLAANVLSKYGKENAINLGYYDPTYCNQSVVYVDMPVLLHETYRILDEIINKQIILSINPQEATDPRNSIILPNEIESLKASFDGSEIQISTDKSLIDYQILSDKSGKIEEIKLVPISRKTSMANTPNEVQITFEKDSEKNIILVITNNLYDYDKILKPEIQIDLTFKREAFGFDKEIAQRAYRLKNSVKTQRIKTDVKFDRVKRVYAKYRMSRYGQNTHHYRNEKSDSIETAHYR
ncbi:MAG: hypothetical protein AB7I27_18365 [Bacteriovoracaceae bacterium]